MNQANPLRADAHAVIIGINKYQDEKIPDLTFARADGEGIYQILTDPELGRIAPNNVILLLDEEATAKNIRSAIGDEISRRAGEQDLVYIYYAGHGSPIMNPKSRARDGMEKYLVPTDAQLDKLRGTGIPMDDIQKFFGWIESKQVMFFIDSCYSGEAGGRTFKNPQYQGRNLLSAEFLDDLAGEGRLVVTACDVNEISFETFEIEHGLFTHYLIEGLKGIADKDGDGLVTVHELYEYVYENVRKHARKLGGSMKPVLKGSIQGKIYLTQYETAAKKQAKPLHTKAQSLYDAGKRGEAYELWQRVLELVPDHTGATQGLTSIENWLREEQRKKEEGLKRKQRALLEFWRAGKLPEEEYDFALSFVEKSEAELNGSERDIRKILESLIAGKMSPENYLKSVKLLREPPIPKEKETPPVSKPVQKKPSQLLQKRRRPSRSQRRRSQLLHRLSRNPSALLKL